MKKSPATIDINLLPKDPFFETAVGRVVHWALSAGRYIVIFTELVVILSFAARFTLDRQVTDLNRALLQKRTVIESYGDLEQNVRIAQERIQEYQRFDQSSNILDNFEHLSEVTPEGIRLSELAVRDQSITARGTTNSQATFNLFVTNLQLSPHFFDITINRVETIDPRNPGLSFDLRANTKELTRVSN